MTNPLKVLTKIGPPEKDIHVDTLFMRGISSGDEAEKARMRDRLRGAKPLFDIIKEHIMASINVAASVRIKDYRDSNWLVEQAHRNGKIEAFEEIWKLLP